MKKITSLVLGTSLLIASATGFAVTAMDSKWMCTTNASSSSVEADQAADNQMQKNAKSAAEAYAFAAKNCRDCTKITCEVQTD